MSRHNQPDGVRGGFGYEEWWFDDILKVNHLAVDGGQRVFGWEHLCYHVNIRIMGTAFMSPQLFTEEELSSSSRRATKRLNMVPTGAEKYIVWRLFTAWENLFMPPILGPMRTSQDFGINEISFLEKTNFPTAFPVTTWAHLKGDAGFFVEVDLSDDSSCFLLHIKDAAAVGRPVQVHSVADKAGWGTLEGDEEVGRTRAVCLSPFQRQ